MEHVHAHAIFYTCMYIIHICVQLSGSVGMIPITVIAAKAHGNLITIKGSTNTVCNAYHNYYTT